MRLTMWALVIALWSVALSGCLDEETVTFVLPRPAVGDRVSYLSMIDDAAVIITILPPRPVLTRDLVQVMAYPAEMIHLPSDRSQATEHITFFHALSTPAVGYTSDPLEDEWIYSPIGDDPPRHVGSALFAFHGFAGRPIEAGETAEIPHRWLGDSREHRDCDLQIERTYRYQGESRGDAGCTGSGIRFVFADWSPYPVSVESHRQSFRLDSLERPAERVEVVPMAPVADRPLMRPYGADGPMDDGTFAYSLRAAAESIRDAPLPRRAQQCLEERPNAFLTNAFLHIEDGYHYGGLTWSSDDGECEGYFESDGSLPHPGIQDRTAYGPWLHAAPLPEAVGLEDAFRIWDFAMEDDLITFSLGVGRDGAAQYTLFGTQETLTMDGSRGRLTNAWMHS